MKSSLLATARMDVDEGHTRGNRDGQLPGGVAWCALDEQAQRPIQIACLGQIGETMVGAFRRDPGVTH
jgi:hypothetical protein